MLYKQYYTSPIGEMVIVVSPKGLIGIWFVGQKYFADELVAKASLAPHPYLTETITQLECYFKGELPDLSQLPLDLQGTDFQQRVWQVLRSISFGQSTTYGEISQQLEIKSAQAVGGAVGHNPVSILIPCHRVLARDGSLTGYAGGIDKKIWLLNHEKINFKETSC